MNSLEEGFYRLLGFGKTYAGLLFVQLNGGYLFIGTSSQFLNLRRHLVKDCRPRRPTLLLPGIFWEWVGRQIVGLSELKMSGGGFGVLSVIRRSALFQKPFNLGNRFVLFDVGFIRAPALL